jgi:hypothetical protein
MATSQFTKYQDVSDTIERWEDYGHGVFGFGGNFAVDHIPHI